MEDPQEREPSPSRPKPGPPSDATIVPLESVAGPPPVTRDHLESEPPTSDRWKGPGPNSGEAAEATSADDGEGEASGERDSVKFARRAEEAEMDMTPMVDIVFQLLIFFMVTASFSLQRSLQIPKPREDRPSTNVEQQDVEEADLEAVIVQIDENGTFLVINADGDEEEAPSEQDLLIKVRRAKASGSFGNVERLLVKASGECLHDRVVMALDVGTAVGMQRISLQTVEDEGK